MEYLLTWFLSRLDFMPLLVMSKRNFHYRATTLINYSIEKYGSRRICDTWIRG